MTSTWTEANGVYYSRHLRCDLIVSPLKKGWQASAIPPTFVWRPAPTAHKDLGSACTAAFKHAFAIDKHVRGLGFDVAAGNASRDEAMYRVERAASPEWKAYAMEAVEWAAQRRNTFTSDAVWWALVAADVKRPHQPKAMGPVMTLGERFGLIVPTERFVPTVRPSRNRAPIRVWKSLIYDKSLDPEEECPH